MRKNHQTIAKEISAQGEPEPFPAPPDFPVPEPEKPDPKWPDFPVPEPERPFPEPQEPIYAPGVPDPTFAF